jgi:hypothetical protein
MVGDDESMRAMRALLKKIAAGPGSTVLLTAPRSSRPIYSAAAGGVAFAWW